jgi:hypothetical protein
MTPQDVSNMKTYIDSLRESGRSGDSAGSDAAVGSGGRYDVVVSGWTGDDIPGAAAFIEPYAEAGTTWWLESPSGAPGWEDEVNPRIQAGPPH